MKNKKILGALAALCMGIILCVSSVFAINYWYTIDNSAAGDSSVSTGKSLKLALTDALNDDEDGLYPGGIVTFNDIKVTGAFDWTTATPDVDNTELPKFALRVKTITVAAATGIDKQDTFPAEFTVYNNQTGTYAEVGTLVEKMVIFADLQGLTDVDGVITFDLRLAFNENADVKFEQHTLTIELEVVAYLDGAIVDGKLADDKILGTDTDADTDNDTKDPANAGQKVDPLA